MESIQKLKEELKSLVDKVEDKAQVEQLAKLSTLVDTVEADTNSLKAENTDLLKSYKEVIKHVSFAATADTKADNPTGDKQAPKFEDFFK